MLGLWKRATVEPTPQGSPGAGDFCVALPADADVDAFHARWKQLGVRVAQAPTRMDFGYTAVALDPAHRDAAHLRPVQRLEHLVGPLRPNDPDHQLHLSGPD